MTRTTARVLLGTVLAAIVAGRVSAQQAQLTGHVATDSIGYFEPDAHDKRAGRNQVLGELEGRLSAGKKLRLFGSVELRADFADRDRDRLYVRELYGDVVYKKFDLRVGRQLISWGKADLVNPTDNLSPRDYTDPLEAKDERLGVLAVRPRIQWRGVQWEGVIVPVFTGSLIPPSRSRWSPPAPPFAPSPFNPGQLIHLTYEFLPTREPATTLANMQYATRLSGSVRGWDVSASYFDGWDDVPRFGRDLSITDPGNATVRIRPEHLRRRAVGGDVATVVGPFTLRAETAYVVPDPLQGPKHLEYVLGVERTFGDMMGSRGTFVLVQWIQSLVPSDFVAPPLDFNFLFQKATMTRVQHNVTADAQIVVEGLYEWERKGYYLEPMASYRFGDHLRVEGLLDVLGGREGEFFGIFAANKRVQFRIRYSF